MKPSASKLETSRQNGQYQVDEQRTRILDAAEKLFLQNGIEKTKMIDIAAQAGIAKMSLYRYFPNRDVIALEIQARMILKISRQFKPFGPEISMANAKNMAHFMINSFQPLRDAYRYIGMFDKLYLDNPADASIPQWTKNRLITLLWDGIAIDEISQYGAQGTRFIMVLSTVIWFLEKLALRGEVTWSDQAVPLEEPLKMFEDMIIGYIDRSIEAQE